MIHVETGPRRRIAIIGSGISGLVTAHLLHGGHDVTVFEADDHVGGHTNTIDVELEGEQHAVDTGFIIYNERNYPNFTRLLDRLAVVTKPSSMSFSVRSDRTGLEYNGTSLNRMFAQRRNLFRPRFHRMIRDILRFNREAPGLLEHLDESVTVGAFLEEHGYGEAFADEYLVPMGASIWSCPPRTFRRFPMRFVIEFFRNHAMLEVNDRPQWRVVDGGSKRYVEALVRPFADRIRLRTPVQQVERRPEGVSVHVDGAWADFDDVVFACHSDQALALLDDPTPLEREVLGAFPYQRNEVVLHTDTSVLPRRRLAWAAWNYRIPADERDAVTITYDMSILQGIDSRHEFCVTLNDDGVVDPDRVIDRFVYEHPLYTTRRAGAQARHAELIGRNRTSYCGAYWGYGFHEDGVNSAMAVARAFEGVPAS